MSFPAHQNAVGVNQLYFNNFLFNHIGRLVGNDAHPTAFLFQKLGFAGVSDRFDGKKTKICMSRL
ncbi:MAG: hypothetical protein IK065_04550 [Neisseriaceae bacterium]|nr:hypothetical protein [Neisseriaceae bacterium]